MQSRIFVTGDTHREIDIDRVSENNFPIQTELNKNDVMIVLGDFGVCWSNDEEDRRVQEWWNSRNFTTIAICGNHENYDMINALPVIKKFGGRLRQVKKSVFYADNGTILTIDGKRCLFINGAKSIDREFRVENISWWREEEIATSKSVDNALIELKKLDYDIDYVFSHTGGEFVVNDLGFKKSFCDSRLSDLLKVLNLHSCEYKHFCGHYHIDRIVNEKTRILYDDIIEL